MLTSQVNVVTLLDARRGYISRLASKYHLEFDDLYQSCAVVALEKIDETVSNPQAYLSGCIRIQAMLMAKHSHQLQPLSLDMPFEDHTDCLADLLPAPEPLSDRERAATERHITAVHQALHRLPREEQDYLQQVYHLTSFRPLSRPGCNKVRRDHTKNVLSNMAYKHLRKDAALAAAVGGV